MATLTRRQPLPRISAAAFRLPILDSYLLREMVGPFLFAFGAFLLFWALNIFFLAADYIINQHAPIFLVLRFVIFRIPQAIPMAFPFGCLFAALLAIGRVMGDNEVTAMRTAGIPVTRITAAPLALRRGHVLDLLRNQRVDCATARSTCRRERSTRSSITPKRFRSSRNFFARTKIPGNVFYVTQVAPDNKTMIGVQIFKPAKYGTWNETLQAKRATVNGTSLILHDVIDTRFNNDGFMTSQQHVNDISIGLPLGETASQFVSQRQQRSLDDEQQIAAHAGQRAAATRHRRYGAGQLADQPRQQTGVAVCLHHQHPAGAAARTALRQARTHAGHRAWRSLCSSSTTSWSRLPPHSDVTERSIHSSPLGCRTSLWDRPARRCYGWKSADLGCRWAS